MRVDGSIIPTLTGTDLELHTEIDGLSLPALSPYTRLHLGREIAAGHGDLTFDLAVRSSDLDGTANFSSSEIGFGAPIPPAPSSALDLALALMMERRGGIELRAPLRAKVDDPEFDFDGLVTRALVDSAVETAEALPNSEQWTSPTSSIR